MSYLSKKLWVCTFFKRDIFYRGKSEVGFHLYF